MRIDARNAGCSRFVAQKLLGHMSEVIFWNVGVSSFQEREVGNGWVSVAKQQVVHHISE